MAAGLQGQSGRTTRRRFLVWATLMGLGATVSALSCEPLRRRWHSLVEFLDRQPYLRPAPPAPARPGQSTVYHLERIPWPARATPFHAGLDALLALMAEDGTALYKFDRSAPLSAPAGLIAADDVVLIKVNAQWPARGMTSTELLLGLIQRLLAYPDGFHGEIIIVENGQGHDSLASANQNNDEQDDHSLSVQTIVDRFPGPQVSLFNWSSIGTKSVREYDEGDDRDGYVLAGAYPLSYPKFTTAAGTRVSLRRGIWNGAGYHQDRLKFINLPVLKGHVFMGATAAVKNYTGVLSRFAGDFAPGDDWGFHANLYRAWNGNPAGLLGSLIALRFPSLTILDALYVNPTSNWQASFENTPYAGMLFAGLDPVALDYYAVKEVLYPMVQQTGSYKSAWVNPDRASIFRRYLLASQARLLDQGFVVRLGQEQIRPVRDSYPSV
jgi:hypothetical protein